MLDLSAATIRTWETRYGTGRAAALEGRPATLLARPGRPAAVRARTQIAARTAAGRGAPAALASASRAATRSAARACASCSRRAGSARRELLRELLGERGLRDLLAPDPDTARRAFDELSPALVVIDTDDERVRRAVGAPARRRHEDPARSSCWSGRWRSSTRRKPCSGAEPGPSDAVPTLGDMPQRPSRIDLLELDIDLRLADLWREAAGITEWSLDVVAAFMRAAYGKGYCDALTEDSPGSLCADHGYRVPGAQARSRPADASTPAAANLSAVPTRSPARLIVALAVAARARRLPALHGGRRQLDADADAEPARGAQPGSSPSSARSSGRSRGDSHRRAGLRFGLREHRRHERDASPVVYRGDTRRRSSRSAATSSSAARTRTAASRARTSSRSARRSTRREASRLARWPSSAARRSSSASGCRSTRSSPARTPRAHEPPPPRRLGAQRALRSFGSTLVAAAVLATALVRHDFSFVYVAAHTNRTLPTAYALSAFWGGQEGSLLLWLLVLTGYGALAVALNRRLLRDLDRLGRAGARRHRDVLRVRARRRREPVRHADRAGRRRRADAEPAEPVHGRAPADALPRLRRPLDPVRVRRRARCSPAAPTSAGSSRRAAGRSPRGRSSASASCSARTGRTSRSAGAATTPGIRSRTPR